MRNEFLPNFLSLSPLPVVSKASEGRAHAKRGSQNRFLSLIALCPTLAQTFTPTLALTLACARFRDDAAAGKGDYYYDDQGNVKVIKDDNTGWVWVGKDGVWLFSSLSPFFSSVARERGYERMCVFCVLVPSGIEWDR